MNELNLEGMAVAPGVVETIVSIAANEVEGVASVGASPAGSIRSVLTSKSGTQGVEVTADDEGKLVVSVRVTVLYGYALPDIAAAIRRAVADAVAIQVGAPVGSVDVYVDAIQFAR